ncbi:hypothetical protein [Rhodococcus sp. NPDC127528]|uniref:hypothetical protein n=1 Tax=unclassified Rhodococcus (in: high G+C Gram-positive bacteria) TaxID=192944 RepID=UPI003627443C
MFIQVIQGKVGDEPRLRRCMDRWTEEVQPGATGYLGSTSGMREDGTFIALVRFDSEESARRNSTRPEQGSWWAETEQCFDGPVSFMDCPDAIAWRGGGSDDAGFVQIMEGRTADASRLSELMTEAGDKLRDVRPEIIGGTFASAGDGGYVEAVYFTNESEARAHEHMTVPDDLRSLFDEEGPLMGEVVYFDLHEPTLVSAGR